MQAYIQSIGSWEVVRPDLLATIEFLKGEGKSELGVCFRGSFKSQKSCPQLAQCLHRNVEQADA